MQPCDLTQAGRPEVFLIDTFFYFELLFGCLLSETHYYCRVFFYGLARLSYDPHVGHIPQFKKLGQGIGVTLREWELFRH